jgi:uncharacterized repeat protein (TIGR03803 family)
MTNPYPTLISKVSPLGPTITLAFAVLLVLAATPAAQTQTFKVLYRFNDGTDGQSPGGRLVLDAKGNLYGTTTLGGDASKFGTVFKVDTKGKETVLHTFTGGADGEYPYAGLIRDGKGNLYGTTGGGGSSGLGTVFKVDTRGKETVLYNFRSIGTGEEPTADLVRDLKGNLYGTTLFGHNRAFGVVFELDTTGKETVLHRFSGRDGANPLAGLVRDTSGNLYGTTTVGGDNSDNGNVFKLDKAGKYTTLYNFGGPPTDGARPQAVLVRDAAGTLYGTTRFGGSSNLGTVFTLDSQGKERVVYSFAGGKTDGRNPYAGLVRDAAGNLYGTTLYGGPSNRGTVFKVDTTGRETVLYSFTGGTDGGKPFASLVQDAAGNLYGTASIGGRLHRCFPTAGCGVVFKITP